MSTKWSLMQDDLAFARQRVERLERELRSLEQMEFGAPCTRCRVMLDTEADFAKHFIVPNKAYRNIGYCPVGEGE